MLRYISPLRPLLLGCLLSFAGWGLVAAVMAAHGVVTRGDAWADLISPGLRDWLPWAILTPFLFRLVFRLPLDRQHWKRAVPVHLLCCGGVLLACHWWKETGRFGEGGPRPGERGDPRAGRFERDRPGPPPDDLTFEDGDLFAPGRPGDPMAGGRPRRGSPPMGFDMLRFMSFELPIYVMIITGAHAALFFRRDQERAASLARARLDALQMQLQPHFLFNTLNTIAGLIHENPNQADAVLTALSDLLRLSLEASAAQETPLRREVEFIERYLALMHARFEDRLAFSIDVAADTQCALVPPMLLQPIVENAVEHGVGPKAEGGSVTVRAWREGDRLMISVADDGVGLGSPTALKEGIGLGNTRARLRQIYGAAAALTLREDHGTIVDIALPFRPDPAAS